MGKLFTDHLYKKKDKNITSSKSNPKEENLKSKQFIVFGFILSFTSIFLLLLTINNKFG